MATAQKHFAIVSENGSVIFSEGQHVPDDIAARYPHFMQGHAGAKQPAHNPALPRKLSRKQAGALGEAELVQWIAQYHPGHVPDKADKAELVDVIMQLQG